MDKMSRVLPSDMADPPSKKVRLVISSADRNLTMDPKPSNYTITLDEPLPDVVSISLVSVSMPLTAYRVNSNNNTLALSLNGGPLTEIIVPEGDYEDPVELATFLTEATTGALVVKYVKSSDKFKFQSAEPFALFFEGGMAPYGPQELEDFVRRTNSVPGGVEEYSAIAGQKTVAYRAASLARTLGFGPKNYRSTSDNVINVITSEYRIDMSQNKTAIVYIAGADLNLSINNNVNKSFVIIEAERGRSICREIALPDRLLTKNYNPPMHRLAKLQIRVLNEFGGPYDFQNHDHRLELLMTCAPRYQARTKWTDRA
jgi:hypothetical protein